MASKLEASGDVAAEARCADERIHRLGMVQRHGAIIAVVPSATLTIVAVSETVMGILYLEASAQSMIGRPISDYLGSAFAQALTVRLANGRLRGSSPWHSQFCSAHAGVDLYLAAHAHDGVIYIEIEPCGVDQRAIATTAIDLLREALVDLRDVDDTLSAITQVTVQGVRLLTGYERVLVYRFDADWNGQTIAETIASDWDEPLGGLHFPAGNIPAQARELYRRTPMRWVADRDAVPVPFLVDEAWAKSRSDVQPIDLSFSLLRSLSPIHLQYYQALGVNGSMSFSIMQGNRLWGLLVCHARRPLYCAPEQRLAAATLVDAFALRVGLSERVLLDRLRGADLATLDVLIRQMSGATDVVRSLTAGTATICDLFGSTGAAVIYHGELALLGVTPPEADVLALVAWLATYCESETIFHCQHLPLIYPPWEAHAGIASGVMAAFLRSERLDLMIWFRPGETERVRWGGAPAEELGGEQPFAFRHALERWTETRDRDATAWAPWETEIAETLRSGVIEVIVRCLRAAREQDEAQHHRLAKEAAIHRSRDAREAELLRQTADRATEDRFRFATEAGKLGVWELNLQNGALTTSAVCKSIFGHAGDLPFTYEALQTALQPIDRDRMRTAIRRSSATRAELEIVVQVTRANGLAGWIQLYARVVSTVDDGDPCLSGISLDVTERVLTEERIRQSQRIEAVGQLTAGVAHDFNNVLQSLMGELELAVDAAAEPAQANQHIARALQATQRGARLTSHLLSFSRRQLLTPTTLSLRPFLEALLGTLGRTLGHTTTIALIVPADLPDVSVDTAQLDSALLNLAINARDAMLGKGTLTIEARLDSGRVALSLTDTGSGMTADVLLHACEPFYTTKGAKGSGLGLSMVQGFARQSGGELRINSVVMKGTRVEIFLPLATQTAPVPSDLATTALPGLGRILLVDDDAAVGQITTTIVRKAGFDVTFAANGVDALRTLRRDPAFDALITDYAMAGMNGADLVLAARKLVPDLPALVITGYTGTDGMDGLPTGVEILRKPFQRQELVRSIQILLNGPPLVRQWI